MLRVTGVRELPLGKVLKGAETADLPSASR
jgi:hypothetical protein